jgi:hypothetical protein
VSEAVAEKVIFNPAVRDEPVGEITTFAIAEA